MEYVTVGASYGGMTLTQQGMSMRTSSSLPLGGQGWAEPWVHLTSGGGLGGLQGLSAISTHITKLQISGILPGNVAWTSAALVFLQNTRLSDSNLCVSQRGQKGM